MTFQTEEVPFNRPFRVSESWDLLSQVDANRHTSGDGPLGKLVEASLSEFHNGASVRLTPSCSASLELAARLIQFEPGDEIIVPSFTFVTSVSSFVAAGATPVFCDIDPTTLGLDFTHAESLISPRTKAICLVHYGGVPADPENFQRLAEKHNLVLVEDNAHGLFGEFKSKPLGTFGQISTLSFHETKNFSCGEGGALVLNDSSYTERADILREKGTNRMLFLQGLKDKYTWYDLGGSWVLSDILAALLYTQLQKRRPILDARESIWLSYKESLDDWATSNGVAVNQHMGTAHIFYLLMPDLDSRQDFMRHMRSRGVQTAFHYQPLHSSPYGKRFVTAATSLPHTERTGDCLVRLPIYDSMTAIELERVVEAVVTYSPN